MQSVPSVSMTEAGRCRPRAVRQVAIRIEDVDEKEQHGVEHYFMRLIWTAKFHGMFFSPRARRFVWMTNLLFNFVVLVIISVAIFYESEFVLDSGIFLDIEISTMLCSIVWTFQSIISMGFLIWWQVSGSLWKYFENVIVHQKGEAVTQNATILKRTVCFAHFTNIVCISMVLLVHYGPESVRSEINKYEIFKNVLLKPLHTFSIIHLCMCWNTTIFLYNVLIDGCFLEAKDFNRKVKKLTADSDREYCRKLVDLISCHSRIAANIRSLDKLTKIYSFVMVASVIPSTLLTLNMLAQRVDDYEDFLMLGLPSVGIIVAAFLGITLAPARLYEEMSRSKNYLCQNINIWRPYREEVHKLAMVLSSHMEQPNLGLTIWGFAILSKAFILAVSERTQVKSFQIFSVLIMLLSLVIEIAPTIKEFIEDLEEEDAAAAIMNSTSV